jgi:hypothetical protein
MPDRATNVLYYGDNLDCAATCPRRARTWPTSTRPSTPTDGPEPPHVHVEGNDGAAKFWLRDVELASSRGYTRRQLETVAEMVRSHRSEFLDMWHEFFG